MPPKFEFLKIRDFGELISDSFVFIRLNFKPMIKAFFTFCGFFLFASAIFSALEQARAIDTFNSVNLIQTTSRLYESNQFGIFGVEYLLTIVFALLNYFAVPTTIFSYIALYKEKGNEPPTLPELWGYIKYFYFRILGSGILIALLLGVASVLCCIPGIYLYPIMALIFPIMIFENTTLGYAFNRSFRLIKDNWWITFGALVIIILIVYFATLAVLTPVSLLNLSSLFLHAKNGVHLSTTLTVITTILEQLCEVFYVLPLITISLCYFSLTERLDSPGLLDRISQLGNVQPDNNQPTEEF